MTEEQIFIDLICRFFTTLPDKEYESFNRIFVWIQQAHWFYCDFYLKEGEERYSLFHFGKKFFEYCNLLHKYLPKYNQYYNAFLDYLSKIKTCGSILINSRSNKVVLVNCMNSWNFPKGKIDEGETELECAIRETREEVGYDISNLIDEKNFLEFESKNGKITKYFIINNVPENIFFKTQTRGEIEQIKWFNINSIKNLPLISPHYNEIIKKFNYNTKEKDYETFADNSKGFSIQDIFRINEEKFGFKSTYNKDDYYS
jgi:mRNA-decapping enzyme subunit 2